MESLGNDLAHIRQEQEMSLDDIHRTTKIPVRILQSIEDGSIFSDLQENPTYIRSYIRSYAKALSIDEQQIIYALDKKEKGRYDGSLQELLEEDYDPKRTTFKFDEGESDTSEEPTKDSTDDANNEMVHDHSPEFESKDKQAEPGKGDSEESQEETPTVQSVDWADMGRQFQPLDSTKSRVGLGITGIVILLAAVVYFFFFDNQFTASVDESSSTQTEMTTGSSDEPADSLQLNVMSPTPADSAMAMNDDTSSTSSPVQNTALTELPDTLNLIVYAAYGKLEPVRVFTDIMDDINPYWLEQGDAYRFNFIDKLQVRGQYSRMELLLNGHPINNLRDQFYNPETRLLEIDRSYFMDDSSWLQAAPDSMPIKAPPPAVIKDRPIYN